MQLRRVLGLRFEAETPQFQIETPASQAQRPRGFRDVSARAIQRRLNQFPLDLLNGGREVGRLHGLSRRAVTSRPPIGWR